MNQTPSIGRIVIVPVAPSLNNGADRAPAIITRVWNEQPDGSWMINARVLCDSESTLWGTSLRLFASEDDALRAPIPGTSHFAYWPPRV
jgi:hypothetical protein